MAENVSGLDQLGLVGVGLRSRRWAGPAGWAMIGLGVVMAAGGCAAGGGHAGSSAGASSPDESLAGESSVLGAAIAARKSQFRASASPEILRVYAEGIEAVRESGVTSEAINVGDRAPEFTLPDANGRPVSLSGVLAQGPAVVVWYRGGWCPYCNLTLKAYQERLGEIEAAGARLVAISPETPDHSLDTAQKNELAFTVLSDTGNAVARRYGVVFSLTGEVHENYNQNFRLDDWNGQKSGELPLAATYVIDRQGIVRYAFLDADYTARADPSEVLAALKRLKR